MLQAPVRNSLPKKIQAETVGGRRIVSACALQKRPLYRASDDEASILSTAATPGPALWKVERYAAAS